MGNIRLSGAAWTWVGATLEEAAGIYRALGVKAMDLIAVPGMALEADEIASDPLGHAERARNLDMELGNLIAIFGAGFEDRALNSTDLHVREKNLATYRGLLEFCAAARVYSIMILPGVIQKGVSRDEALDISAAEMRTMNTLALETGVLLAYEPHVESILESPGEILDFVKRVPDIKLVLDYGHCVSLGYKQNDIDPLAPYAGHVHLRQASTGKIQARWTDGEIDFKAVMELLEKTGYEGYVTLEYEHDEFWDMDKCDVMTETIKMRDAVRPYVSS
jgi:sugar phosphate isomerase/epimerase